MNCRDFDFCEKMRPPGPNADVFRFAKDICVSGLAS